MHKKKSRKRLLIIFYDELFFNHPIVKDVLDKANLANRTPIYISNPYMHRDTPTDRKEFWLDLKKLKKRNE